MERIEVKGIAVFFEAGDEESAVEIGGIAAEASRFMAEHWGLTVPPRYRVYVLTSLVRFRLHSAPWPYWLGLLPLLPLWYHAGTKLWAKVGGLTERWAFRPAIGVKPRRLLQTLDRSVGQRFMIEESDAVIKLRHIISHELMHAFTAHLRLPMWINEGLAVLTSERFLGKPVVKSETRALLMPKGIGKRPQPYHRIIDLDAKALAYEYVRGYWITRFIDEKAPMSLRDLLKKRRSHDWIEKAVAAKFGLQKRMLWQHVDSEVAGYYATVAG